MCLKCGDFARGVFGAAREVLFWHLFVYSRLGLQKNAIRRLDLLTGMHFVYIYTPVILFTTFMSNEEHKCFPPLDMVLVLV